MKKQISKKHLIQLLITFVSTGLIVSCGGGGGSSATTSSLTNRDFSGFSNIKPSSNTKLEGGARSTIDGVQTAFDASLTINTDANTNETESTLSMEGFSGTYTKTYNALSADGVTRETADGTAILATENPTTAGYEYQTYGIWADSSSTNPNLGVVSVGAPTTGAAIPTSGNANFTGNSIGYYTTSGDIYGTESNVSASVDFAARNVNLSSSNTTKIDFNTSVESPATDLDFSGTLGYSSGNNAFSGRVSTSRGANELVGDATGRFYGPNTEELGGTFGMGNATEGYYGSYGAKQ